MAQAPQEKGESRPKGRKGRMLRNGFRVAFLALLVALAIGWLQRERIADDFIADALRDRNVPATYTVESVSPRKQVLSNVVIGDPKQPDLTVERMEVLIRPRLGLPDITEVRLTRPRLFGTLHHGQVSLGTLDTFLFTGEEKPFEFPALRLAIDDGRALMETDYGRMGLKLSGSGHLRGGFEGELAVVAPTFAGGGCEGESVTLYGHVGIDAERPEFQGPLRFDGLRCEEIGLVAANGGFDLDLQAERNLEEYEGELGFLVDSVALTDMNAGLRGDGRFTWRDGDLNIRYDLVASDAATPYATVGSLGLEGRVRALNAFERIEVEGDLLGSDLRMGPLVNDAIADAARAAEDTLLGQILDRIGLNLARHLRGSEFSASFTARHLDGRSSVTVPEARLRGGSGATLLALSRGQADLDGKGVPRLSGSFQTAGDGLPQITGRMEQTANGAVELRMAMREYSAGSSRLALSDIRLMQARNGALALNGRALASGPLPGGAVVGLQLPLDASLSPAGDLAVWRGCRNVRFDRLSLANLSLAQESLTLCPPAGRPILSHGEGGLRFAAGLDRLDIAGELAETPITVQSGPIGLAWPGALVARNLDIQLGPQESAQRFAISDLRADLSAGEIAGDFAGADVFLASVPLDITDASGNWTYTDEALRLTGGQMQVEDRETLDRFEALSARDAELSLSDNLVTANAILREPVTGRAITSVRLAHDLGTGAGHADLTVDSLTFDDTLQPAPTFSQCQDRSGSQQMRPRGLSCLVLGVVSDVRGTVDGTGRIDWDADGVTSSGEFTTDSLDLAAAFGPVRGASGTVVFSDLLGLTTAPDQRISVASVNPGVEVFDGEVSFQMVDGELLRLRGGSWPFMGGTLTLRPVDIRFGVQEVRSYVLVIDGLEASLFIERMEMANLAASGTFDGIVPIIFDEDGNGRLEAGVLVSRPPGGHLAYIGELTYEDMGFFANYAFRTLRDLAYDRMEIEMNGPLAGELVTQVRFGGIGQGETAERNIVSRAIGSLPIDLRINIRAPFYRLMTSVRSLYDPSVIRDPRSLGLVDERGEQLREEIDHRSVEEREAIEAAEEQQRLRDALSSEDTSDAGDSAIQPQESEPTP